jgi:hypothetical protein
MESLRVLVIWIATYVDQPRLDGSEAEVVLFVRFLDLLVIVDHPFQLNRGEIRGKLQSRSVMIRDTLVRVSLSLK